MWQIAQNESTAARRRVPIYALDDTDGKTPETGLSWAASDIKVSKNGAAEANSTGSSGEIAGGLYYYEFAAAEVDTLGFLTARCVKSGVRTFVVAVQVTASSGTDWSTGEREQIRQALGVDGTKTATSGGNLDAVKAKTDLIPAAGPADAAVYTAGRAAKIDNLDAAVSSRSAPGDAMTLTPAERGAAAEALLTLADGVTTGFSLRRALRAIAAMLAGDVTGAGTGTELFWRLGDSGTVEVTVPVDAQGNRTGVEIAP